MAEQKKETVRIALPPRPDNASSPSTEPRRDSARIVPPSRTPVAPPRHFPPKITPSPSPEATIESLPISLPCPSVAPPQSVAPSPLLQPLTKPPGLEMSSQSSASIAFFPVPAMNMAKTEPVRVRPTSTVQPVPVLMASKPPDLFDSIPRPFCWALFGLAALIFLIQILNYVVS
jgi:hypothetical protein